MDKNILYKHPTLDLSVEIIYAGEYCPDPSEDLEKDMHVDLFYLKNYNIRSSKNNSLVDIAYEYYGFEPEDEEPTENDAFEFLKNQKDFLIKTVYVYIHSGMAISLSPFSCRWDSGIGGFIYQKFDHELTELEKENALKTFECIIDEYDRYSEGDWYEIKLIDDIHYNTEYIDSGYYDYLSKEWTEEKCEKAVLAFYQENLDEVTKHIYSSIGQI